MQTSQVFVSHTSDMAQFPEGRSFVQAVLDAVNRAGMAPVDMRYFAAREGKPSDYCRLRVRECEIYVAVVGLRYGSMVPGEVVSYTELEFDEATTAGLPRLVFLLDGTAGSPTVLADADRGAVEGFRQRLRDAGLVVRTFTSDAALELEVFHALMNLAGTTPSAVPFALEVRYSLPPDTAAFTGRDEELDLVITAVTAAGQTGGVMAIHAIGGMPGVGKTALAIHIAHLLKSRFPDRQLLIDLHGHTPGQDPVSPEAALAGLLTATGVDARYLPEDLESRTGLWRDRMAGQQALLVLDNAASSAQVAPLLPRGDDCLVLITSRRHLGDLPGVVVPVLLDALLPDQAMAMFLQLAPRAATCPAAAVQELVRLAGYLPLAVSLLARLFDKHPTWAVPDLIADTRNSLLTVTAENATVAAALDVSYQDLPPGRERFFRYLGLHPGPDIDSYAAAALAGIPLAEASEHLNGLHSDSLLAERGYRRYRMHDLIREYARALAANDSAEARDQALNGLLSYYQQAAAAADARLARQTQATVSSVVPQIAVPDLLDQVQALAWMQTERANLLSCIDHAARHSHHGLVIGLTASMASVLRLAGPWTQAATLHASAAAAARRIDDRPGEASALYELGVILQFTDDYPGADRALEQALALYRDLGDQLGEANTVMQAGNVRALNSDYPRAARAQEQALALYQHLGDRLGEASTLKAQGIVRQWSGDYPEAVAALEQALGLYGDLGDRLGEADVVNELGIVQQLTGNYPRAARLLEHALSMYPALGDRLGEANALGNLGVMRKLTGDYEGAAEALERALGLFRDLGSRLGEANVLNEMGIVRQLSGDYQGAARALDQALPIHRNLSDRRGEAEALNYRGTLHRRSGELQQAAADHQQALNLAIAVGSQLERGRALEGTARCAQASGDAATARTLLRHASEIYERIGAAEATQLMTELAEPNTD